MIRSGGDFDAYVFSKQPSYNEKAVRRTPLRMAVMVS